MAHARVPQPIASSLVALLLLAACSSAGDAQTATGSQATTTVSLGHRAVPLPPPTTAPIPSGSPDRPFSPVPPSDTPTAVVSPTGVVLPVISASGRQPPPRPYPTRWAGDARRGWLVLTPCSGVRTVFDLPPLGRAHVVLDPGHGGREPGAVGPSGLLEKDLNLEVALAARAKLEARGATVILTRETDITMTTGARAYLARSVLPGLFVSIHHNGGAPPNGDQPGTIVFTKAASEAATRFGGLFHQSLNELLIPIGEAKREEHRLYRQVLDEHEAAVAAYDQSVAARDAALVANGQIPPAATTIPAPADPLAAMHQGPSVRHPITTTTVPPPADQTTVAVPDTLPVPPPLEAEPVPEFRWAGAPNAGVRSWVDPGGQDMLSVLRRSGDVPAALVEYLYLTNPVEEALLADPAFVDSEAQALVEAIVTYFSTDAQGTGFVRDQIGDQHIGGGGQASNCVEPDLGLD